MCDGHSACQVRFTAAWWDLKRLQLRTTNEFHYDTHLQNTRRLIDRQTWQSPRFLSRKNNVTQIRRKCKNTIGLKFTERFQVFVPIWIFFIPNLGLIFQLLTFFVDNMYFYWSQRQKIKNKCLYLFIFTKHKCIIRICEKYLPSRAGKAFLSLTFNKKVLESGEFNSNSVEI